MKLAAISFFLGILLLSCQSKQEQYYWQSIRIRGSAQLDTIHADLQKTTSKNGHTIGYQMPYDTVEYIRDTVANQLFLRKHDRATIDTLWHIESRQYLVEGKSYQIERFKTPTASIDGGADIYWSDEIGMFFLRASAWPEYEILQSSNEELSKRIWALVKASYPKIKEEIYSKTETGNKPLLPNKEHLIDDRYHTQ